MNLQQFTQIEVHGLAETICEYTRDHYIRNYAKKLIEFSESKQYELLLTIIDRLVEWYSKEVETMKSNNYIYNLETHLKSFNILIEIQKKLKEETYE